MEFGWEEVAEKTVCWPEFDVDTIEPILSFTYNANYDAPDPEPVPLPHCGLTAEVCEENL